MRVFITAAGMIGCHTGRELLDRGDEITFFDMAPRPDYIARIVKADVPVVRGDVRELPGLIDAVQTFKPDVIVHTAGLIAGAAQQLPFRGFEINVMGTLNVAEAARLTGVRRLVHASTLGVVDRSAAQTAPMARISNAQSERCTSNHRATASVTRVASAWIQALCCERSNISTPRPANTKLRKRAATDSARGAAMIQPCTSPIRKPRIMPSDSVSTATAV